MARIYVHCDDGFVNHDRPFVGPLAMNDAVAFTEGGHDCEMGHSFDVHPGSCPCEWCEQDRTGAY